MFDAETSYEEYQKEQAWLDACDWDELQAALAEDDDDTEEQ